MKAKKFTSILITAVICLLVGVIITLSIIIGINNHANDRELLNEESTINVVLMEEQLRDAGFLVTEEYLVTLIQDNEQHESDWWGNEVWWTSSRVVFSYDALVRAGVDFANVEVRVDEHRRTITIYIPEAQIYGVPEIDPDSYQLYLDESDLFSTGFNMDDFNTMLGTLQEEAKIRAAQVGILDRANENAINMVTNMLDGIICGVDEYNDYQVNVEFQSGSPVRE